MSEKICVYPLSVCVWVCVDHLYRSVCFVVYLVLFFIPDVNCIERKLCKDCINKDMTKLNQICVCEKELSRNLKQMSGVSFIRGSTCGRTQASDVFKKIRASMSIY